MKTKKRWVMAMAAVAVVALASVARAAGPATTITIPSMHCGGCAKKVAASLAGVPGVASVQPSVQAKTATVMPAAQVTLSPRALWDAVERAGKQPTRLEGPSGVFTAKPQS